MLSRLERQRSIYGSGASWRRLRSAADISALGQRSALADLPLTCNVHSGCLTLLET